MDENRRWQHVSGDFSISLNHVKHPVRGEIFFTLFVNYDCARWKTEEEKRACKSNPNRISFQIACYGQSNPYQKREFFTYDTYEEAVQKMAEIMNMTVPEYEAMPSLVKTLIALNPEMEWTKEYGIATS